MLIMPSVFVLHGVLQIEDAVCVTCSCSQMTLLLVSSAAFGMCKVTVMVSCEDYASSGAAAVGRDAVFTTSFVSEVSAWAPSSPGGVTAPAYWTFLCKTLH